jgi:lauroyl/myristoyl acyltransferase
MIFGESALKDLYRKVVWGPGRQLLESAPDVWEIRAVRAGGRAIALAMLAKRRALRDNLRRAFPEVGGREIERLAQHAFAAHFTNQYISFSFGKCHVENWPQYLAFEGLDRLQEAYDRGKGVVLMHPHLGPAQLPLHVLGLLGFPMHQVGGGEVTLVELSDTGRWAAELRASLEKRMPVTLHDGKGYLRPLLRALDAGEVVMSACDATGGGQEIGRRLRRTVLGQPFSVPVGPVWMALRSGAPLLTIHCHKNPGARPGQDPAFIAEIGPEIPLDRDAPLKPALEAGADEIAAFLDKVLRAWPGDWQFWDGFAPGGLLPEET